MKTPICINSSEGNNSMPALRTIEQVRADRARTRAQETFDKSDQARRVALLKAQPEEA